MQPNDGPTVLEPKDLIPITPFANNAGLPIFTSQADWERVVRHEPYTVLQKMMNAIDGALKTARADIGHIDFRVWVFEGMEGAKKKRARLRASLYITEEGMPWVHLSQSPQRMRRR
jgi:hypothetical protein